MNARQTVTAIVGLLALLASSAAHAARPNVLMIVADDLGYSDLGCYGSGIDTQHIDALAKDGVRLTRFYNTGRCCPSRASILTGQYPHRVGVGHKVADLGRPGYRGFVSPDAQTIAEALKPSGYRSFIAGKWHLGTPDPTKHGFEEFYGTLVSAQTFWDPDHFLRTPAGRPRRGYSKDEFYGTDATTDHALDFLAIARQAQNRPWFLYVAYHAPHFPLHAREADIKKYQDRFLVGWDRVRERRLARMKQLGIVPQETKLSQRSRYWNYGETRTGVNPAWESLPKKRRTDLARRMAIYAAMIDRVDHNVGRIIEDLEANGEFDDTLVFFLSDNGACAEWDPHGFDIKSSNQNILHEGEALKRMGGPGTYHSVGSGWANASNTPWRLQKHYAHEGGISSPCVVHWPKGNVQKGVINDQPCHVIDLMPTVLAAADTKYGGKIPLAGASLLPTLKTGERNQRTLFFEHEGNRGVHQGKWKLVSLRDEPWELYDITTDRIESKDLAKKHPMTVAKLAARWDRWGKANYVTPLPDDYGVDYLRPPKAKRE